MDRVEMQVAEATPKNYFKDNDSFKSFLEKWDVEYKKNRVYKEVYESSWYTICNYVKTHEGWEYFIDYIHQKELNTTSIYPVTLFNHAQVRCGYVEFYYSPIHNLDDKNSIYYGRCTFDELLDIENIINEHKANVKNVKYDISVTQEEYNRISNNLNEILSILDKKENIGGSIANLKYSVADITKKILPYVQVQ